MTVAIASTEYLCYLFQSEHASVIYGTKFPDRMFVGCLPSDVTALELGEHFTKFGKVLEAKILKDEHGRSKRFGFVTFEAEESVARVLAEKPIIVKGKVVNVGLAVKKDTVDKTRAVSSVLTQSHIVQRQPVFVTRPTVRDNPPPPAVYYSAPPACLPPYQSLLFQPQVFVPSHQTYPTTISQHLPIMAPCPPPIPCTQQPLRLIPSPLTTTFHNQQSASLGSNVPMTSQQSVSRGSNVPITSQQCKLSVAEALRKVLDAGKKCNDLTRYDPSEPIGRENFVY